MGFAAEAGAEASLTPAPAPFDQFALVAYIPEPLGPFIDSLRKTIVPGCQLRSHVSVLPPRPLIEMPDAAESQIARQCVVTARFRLYLTRIELFRVTNVIYLALGQGSDRLVSLHDSLNRESLAYDEPFQFHPHVTLAQELPPDTVDDVREFVTRRWAECKHDRFFEVETITFAQNLGGNNWSDLGGHRLSL